MDITSRQLTVTIADIPPEILNIIFTFLLVPSILNQFRFFSLGRSFWSSSLCDLKSITSVCKLWREESIHYLYDYITVYRPHHLAALLQSLGLSPHYARHIRRFEITAAGTVGNCNQLETSQGSRFFVKLFRRCPNLTSLTIGPGWNGYQIPGLDWTTVLAPLSSQVTNLTLRADYLVSRKDFSEVLIALGANLTTLSIQNDTNKSFGPQDETGDQYRMYEVRLPVLQSLVLCCFSSIAAPLHWEMNSLRALTIHRDDGSAVLRKYGAQLKYLCLLSEDIPRDSIEKYCPSLQHLVISSQYAPFPGIKHLDFWVKEEPALPPTAPSNSRYFDADLLHPEFGFPALPYLFPPTNRIQTDVEFVGGDSHCIQVTERGHLFTGLNCQAGNARDFDSYAESTLRWTERLARQEDESSSEYSYSSEGDIEYYTDSDSSDENWR